MPTDPAQAALPAGLSANAFSSLFQAVNGLRNRTAILALLGCTFAGVLVAGLLMFLAGTLGFLAALLAALVWFVAIGTGVNAAGLLQMDHARGVPPRSIVDALVFGLMCIPKLIVLGLAFFAVEIAVFIGLYILLLICKIPFLGPLLFVVVFPLSVVVAGVTIFGLFICMVLSLPAIWQGETIMRALAQTLAIVKSRLVETLLLLFIVGFIAFAVGLIIFGVLGAGLIPTIGMSASAVGFSGMGGGMGSIMGMMQGGGGGHAIAGLIGGFLLWAVAGSLVGQVYLLGIALVYLRVTEGLDLGASEAALRAKLDDARRRAAELSERAKNAAQREGAPSAPAAAPVAAAPLVAPFAAPVAPPYNPPPPYEPPAPYVPPPAAYDPPPPPYNPAPPPYNPPPAYHPPPAFSAAPTPPVFAPAPAMAPHEHAPATDDEPDIALPFDEAPPPAPVPVAAPAFGSPPAWMPPPVQVPVAAPPPLPIPTACPQCLSPITGDDVFCGVCGYRLK
ncbi:MAG: zinc ribbon domain-containing protein [Caldimonas sp.]